jgi:hypothetical protein
VPRQAFEFAEAVTRFALLKREGYPDAAVARLYDLEHAKQLSRECPVLNQAEAVVASNAEDLSGVLATGLADAVRRAYPDTTPGVWLTRLKSANGLRLVGLLLVVFWMAPVALGTQPHAFRRLLAAWLAACGALGLAVSLAILYQMQLAYGSIYLLAGAGSSLYLAGLFCGNRLADSVLQPLRSQVGILRCALVITALIQVGVALCVFFLAEHVGSAVGLICLCFAAGCAAGTAVPTALAVSGQDEVEGVPVFVFADALGAAVAGLLFVVLVPLAGLWQAAICFEALVCGVALCAALSRSYARLTAGLALVVALAVLGGRLVEVKNESRALSAGDEGPRIRRSVETTEASALPGIPRRLDLPRIRELMQRCQLATNTASYWEPVRP